MTEIVNSIRRVTDIMGEITAASQEQTSGIEQINQVINQMDEVTQQNAALVEQAAAAVESLQDQTGNLERVVSVFKLDGARAAVAAPAKLAAHPTPDARKGTARVKAVGHDAKRPSTNVKPLKHVENVPAATGDEWGEF